MTAQILRQMSHKTLVGYVQGRLTAPAVAASPTTVAATTPEEPHQVSRYTRNTNVPAARITSYPKRRGSRARWQAQFTRPATSLLWDTMNPNDLPAPQPDEPRYEDFLKTETRRRTTSAA